MGKLTQTTAQIQKILNTAAMYPEPSVADAGKTPVVNSEGTGFDLQTPQGGEVESLTDKEVDAAVGAELVTTTVTNGTAIGDSVIVGTAIVTIVPNENCLLPQSVLVTNAMHTYNAETGVINLSGATDTVTISAKCESLYKKCTVVGLGNSDPTTVTFTKDADFTKADLGIEEVTVGSDVFVKIPTMYRKVNSVSDNQITSFTIANAKIDNDYEPYSCFIDESGNLLPYILIGKYWNTQTSGCVSTTEAMAASVRTAVGRNYARARGTGYQLFDWQILKLWQDLIICFKMTVNTNDGSAVWTYDELGIYWTTSGGWVDGVMGSSGTWNFCTKPSKYTSLNSEYDPVPSDYVSAGYAQPKSTSQEIQKLGYDSTNPFFSFPSAVTSNNSYNTYYCDGYWYNSSNRPVTLDVGAIINASYGAFRYSVNTKWSGTAGVRLCYRPVA